MFKMFGISSKQPTAQIEGENVVFMFDTPHLMKSVRNNLMKHSFLVDGNTVKWDYIKQFYECDSKMNIRMAPKLTDKHLDLPPFAAMRVCLATQVISHTVAAGILTYVTLGKLPDEAMATAEFVEKFDGLFDCFNVRNVHGPKPLHCALTGSSVHWSHLETCEKMLRKLKVLGSKVPTPCVEGWLLNIVSLRILWSVMSI